MAEQMPDPFEAFRKLWGPLGMPIPGMAMPTLDPAEIDKRIAELRPVEAWLTMNLNMVKLAIQGLEVQRSALQAMQAGADNTAAMMRDVGAAAQAAMQAATGRKDGDGGQGKG